MADASQSSDSEVTAANRLLARARGTQSPKAPPSAGHSSVAASNAGPFPTAGAGSRSANSGGSRHTRSSASTSNTTTTTTAHNTSNITNSTAMGTLRPRSSQSAGVRDENLGGLAAGKSGSGMGPGGGDKFEKEKITRSSAHEGPPRTTPQRALTRSRSYSGGMVAKGTFPRGEETHEAVWGRWGQADHTCLNVRGRTYMTDRLKIPAGMPAFDLVHLQISTTGTGKVSNFMEHADGYLYQMAQRRDRNLKVSASAPIPAGSELINYQQDFVLGVHFQNPASPNYAVVAYFVMKVDASHLTKSFIDLLHRFVTESDDFRNNRFKIIPRVAEGNIMIKNFVGTTPAILGRKITCNYYQGKVGPIRYLEVEVDIGSSMIASQLCGRVQGYGKNTTIDLHFMIEGTTEDELPEQMLGGVRLKMPDISKAQPLGE